MRLFRFAGGLIALALLVAVPAAQAGLVFTIDGQTGKTTGNTSTVTVPFTADGLTFTKATAVETANGITVTADFTGTSTSAVAFSAQDSSLSYGANTGVYATGTVSSAITAGSGLVYLSSQATVTGGTFGIDGIVPNGTAQSQSTGISFAGAGPGLTVSGTISKGFVATAGGEITASGILTAVPEPTGVLIGLVGLPCLGAVVYLARRRVSAVALAA